MTREVTLPISDVRFSTVKEWNEYLEPRRYFWNSRFEQYEHVALFPIRNPGPPCRLLHRNGFYEFHRVPEYAGTDEEVLAILNK